ncbi:hypothetical protein EV426DRAFT_344620 [Tirmania nivea]|nr:hypothetical protein EV426DRAFT_344620 [Tirmania nivea]
MAMVEVGKDGEPPFSLSSRHPKFEGFFFYGELLRTTTIPQIRQQFWILAGALSRFTEWALICIALGYFLFFWHGKFYPPNTHLLSPMRRLIQHIHTTGHKKAYQCIDIFLITTFTREFFPANKNSATFTPSSGAFETAEMAKSVGVVAGMQRMAAFFFSFIIFTFPSLGNGASGILCVFFFFSAQMSTHATKERRLRKRASSSTSSLPTITCIEK